MRLCFLIHDISKPGGTERAQSNLANALAAHGFEVAIWSCYGAGQRPAFAIAEQVSVKFCSRRPVRGFVDYPWLILSFAWFVWRKRPDWVVCTDTNRILVALLAARIRRVRVAVWEHFALVHSMSKLRGRIARHIAARLASCAVTLTPRDERYYAEHLRPAGSVVSIPNVLRLPEQQPTERGYEILAAGRLTQQKGFDLLLNAWAKACKRLPEWSLRIAGEGELRADLEKQIHQLGLERRAILCGHSGDLFAQYSRCGIFVLSSRFEGLPSVLMEAMACGAACISFDCPNGPRELIRDGVNGVLVPAGDVDQLAETLVELAQQEQVRRRLGEAARGIALEFSEEKIVAQWQDVFYGGCVQADHAH